MGNTLSPERRKSVYKFVLVSDLKQRIDKLIYEKKLNNEILNLLINEYPVCNNCSDFLTELFQDNFFQLQVQKIGIFHH